MNITPCAIVLAVAFALPVPLACQTPCASLGADPATRDWFVDPTATNPSAPGTKADPLPTLGAAIALADDNDRIFLAPGVYSPATGEAFGYQVGGASTFTQLNLQIIGYAGASNTILDGMGSASANGLIRFRLGGRGARLTGVTLRNYAGTLGAIRLGSTSAGFEAIDVEIAHCIIEASAGWGIATFGASSGLLIHDNLIRGCAQDGLWLSDIGTVLNPCSSSSGGGDVYNNTIAGCVNGIRLQGGSWNVFNNILANNTASGAYDFGGAPFAVYTMDYNAFFGNGSNYGPGVLPGSNDVTADPLFVNPGAGDYRLGPGSPCEDAGTPMVPPSVGSDLDRNPRFVQGASGMVLPDIGAFERTDVLHTVTSPVSLSFGAVSLDVSGPPGDLVIRAVSAGEANTLVAPGNLLLDPATLVLLDAALVPIPAGGVLSLGINITGLPPTAVGAVVYSQAGVAGPSGVRFTNLVTSVICP